MESHAIRVTTDDELMAMVMSDDVNAAVEELGRRYRARVYRIARGIVRDHHSAEDVCEEVFAIVFVKHRTYRPGKRFSAWLTQVTRNQALLTHRRIRRVPEPIGALEHMSDEGPLAQRRRTTSPDGQSGLEELELVDLYERAVADLPRSYRQVFDSCVRRGEKYRQVAKRLDMPIGTVAIRILRARQRLFQQLEPHIGRPRRAEPRAEGAAFLDPTWSSTPSRDKR